jgi:endo-1,4-beta-xylanase
MISAARGEGRVAALTFDDGPNGDTTRRLLDFLLERDIRATFCVIGANILAPGGAGIVRRMVREGHLLGNHSTSHADMSTWSEAAIEADLLENLGVIRRALNDPDASVPYFRAPNGNWGRTTAVAASLGMRSLAVVNTIDDWRTQDFPALIENLRAAIKPGELVLAHDGGGDREATVDAVIAVVSERLAEGWTFTLPSDSESTSRVGGRE